MSKPKRNVVASADHLPDHRLGSWIRTPMNFVVGESINDFEVPYGASLVPPETPLTIRQQLERIQGGGMVKGREGDYDPDAPDFTKMDHIELIQWRERALSELDAIRDRHRQASIELARQQDEAAFEAEVARRMSEAGALPPTPLSPD